MTDIGAILAAETDNYAGARDSRKKFREPHVLRMFSQYSVLK